MMNNPTLPAPVRDGNVKLSAEDAAAIAAYHATLEPVPARTVSPDTRKQIQATLDEYIQATAIWVNVSMDAPRKVWRSAQRQRSNLMRLLDRARRKAYQEFGQPRGWKYEGNLGVAELHNESLAMTWCETCGGLCQADPNHYRHCDHDAGHHDAFALRFGYHGRTEGVIQHTEHPLYACVAFADFFRLKATPLDFSWYGKPLAVLFERAGK